MPGPDGAPEFAWDHALVKALREISDNFYEAPYGRVERRWYVDGKAREDKPIKGGYRDDSEDKEA